MFSNLI